MGATSPQPVLPTHGRAIDPRPLLARHTAATLIAARARARMRHHGRTSLALAAVAGAALLLLTVGAVTAGGGGGRGQWAASAWRSPLLPSASMHVDVSRRRGKTATPPADARAASLAAVASLKTLFEQQRLAAPRAERTTPTAAHLRAAAGAALNAAAAPVAADLAAEREAATAAVRATLEARQLGGDCSRLLVGSVNKGCGFACQIHHAVHLLSTALATNRTLVMYTENWSYSNTPDENNAIWAALAAGAPVPVRPPIDTVGTHSASGTLWGALFAPITSCVTEGETWARSLPVLQPSSAADVAREPAVVVGLIDGAPFDWDPPAVPADVFGRVARFHARPEVWWAGVLADWVLRPSPSRARAQSAWARAAGLLTGDGDAAVPTPYIGVHVRRTDKVVELIDGKTGAYAGPAEAAAVDTEAYIAAAEAAWAVARTGASPPWPAHPTIYLASDDEAVLAEAASKWPHIRFVSHPSGAAVAAAYTTRATPDAAVGVADDVHFLSRSAFLVGSFSSQVSRLAYEVMQVAGPAALARPAADATLAAHSVDDAWYFGGGPRMRFCAGGEIRAGGGVTVERGDALLCDAAAGGDGGGAVPCRAIVSGADVMVPAPLMVRCADHWRGGRLWG